METPPCLHVKKGQQHIRQQELLQALGEKLRLKSRKMLLQKKTEAVVEIGFRHSEQQPVQYQEPTGLDFPCTAGQTPHERG
jgi:hypothetical protein